MRRWLIVFTALVGACSRAPDTPVMEPAAAAAGNSTPAAIDWVRPQTVSEIDQVFATAAADNRPVFLFWTAVWCPPCNQVKSTIFTRPDFIAKSRAFVPVYVDADSPSGQQLGARFQVSGYPTMVLLDGGGRERTRLAGSVDAAKYMQLLDRGLAGGRSAHEALAAALAGERLPPEDWRLLAFYSWSTDDGKLVAERDLPATLLKLAIGCPAEQREPSSRLVLQALQAIALAKDNRPAFDSRDALASVRSLLDQPQLVRDNHDILGYAADDIVPLLTAAKSRERIELTAQWNAVLDRLAADATLSNGGRMYAVLGKVLLARLEQPEGRLPAALLDDVKAQADRTDRETTGADERQAVITLTAAVLARAGLLDESDALLTAELPRSHSPYYYMSQLASNAKKRGTAAGNAAAVKWARQAYDSAQGTATRLRWGGSYLNTLLELTPDDARTIERAAAEILAELNREAVALTGNNRVALERMNARLLAWNGKAKGQHEDVLARLNASARGACAAGADNDRAWCERLFLPATRA